LGRSPPRRSSWGTTQGEKKKSGKQEGGKEKKKKRGKQKVGKPRGRGPKKPAGSEKKTNRNHFPQKNGSRGALLGKRNLLRKALENLKSNPGWRKKNLPDEGK